MGGKKTSRSDVKVLCLQALHADMFSREERWKSECIQVGGINSARGVLGHWFDKYTSLFSVFAPPMLIFLSETGIEQGQQVRQPSGKSATTLTTQHSETKTRQKFLQMMKISWGVR